MDSTSTAELPSVDGGHCRHSNDKKCPAPARPFVAVCMKTEPTDTAMSAPNKNGFLLMFSSDEWYNQLPYAELQEVIKDAKAWIASLTAEGKAKGGLVLERRGATISGFGQRTVTDGPFVESKEAIGGTLLLDVTTLEEAIAIARTSPTLRYNTTVEVRPIGDECPLDASARRRQQEASLAEA